MSKPDKQTEQRPAVSLALFSAKRITALTDAAMKAFNILYDIERQQRIEARARLKAELDKLDLFGLTANKANAEAEEYEPDERDWCP